MSETETAAQPPPAPRASWAQIAVQLGSAALLLWLYGVDLLDALRFPGAETSMFAHPPSLAFNGLATLATLAAAAAAIFGHVKKLPASFRGFRLLPIVAVLVLFADLFVVASTRAPLSAADTAQLAVQEYARRLNTLSTPTRVPTRQVDLTEQLKDLPAPPFFQRGKRLEGYTVELRKKCSGPATDKNGAPLGTLIYCLGEDDKEAWVTLVGLTAGDRFGAPAIFERGHEAIVGEVHLPVKSIGDDDQPPPPDDVPMPGSRWEDLVDSGAVSAEELNGPAAPPEEPPDAGVDAGS